METIASLLALALLAGTSSCVSWPSVVPLCGPNEDADSCTLRVGTPTIQDIADGVPEKSLPPLDPLVLPSYVINNMMSNNIRIYMELGPTSVTGFRNSKLTSSRTDTGRRHTEWDVEAPEINFESAYNATGDLLLLPITGSGISRGKLDNVKMTVGFDYNKVSRNGNVFYQVANVNVAYTTTRLYLVLSGAKPTLNAALDDNWDLVNQELSPFVERNTAALLEAVFNRVLATVPAASLAGTRRI